MKNKKDKLGRIIGVLAALAIVASARMAYAAEDAGDIKAGMVLQINDDATLYEEPDKPAAVAAALEKGTPVIITQDAKDGWCMVSYQGQSGYVQTSHLGIVGDGDELADEFKAVSEEGIASYQEADMQQGKFVSERMWGIAIAVLVIAIFGAGMLSAAVIKQD